MRISANKPTDTENCVLNEAPVAFGVVILAAGASTRMGRCKLLLPWGDKTILTHLLDQWRSTGAAQIAPVIDPSNQLLRKALADAGFSPSDWIENPSPQLGMFSSLQEASRWTGWLSTLTHWIISLGDQPHIQISTLRLLLDAARKIPRAFASQRFTDAPHTRLFFQRVISESSLKVTWLTFATYIRTREALRLRVAVEDPGVSERPEHS